MDVDTRLLRYFAAVAETGNLTRAADRLFISQPALTKQIRHLETELGTPLFTRSRDGMALTEAGQALAERVPDLLAGWDRILRETKRAADSAARVLRVGFLASAANEATTHIIAEFTRRRPGWRADMRQAGWSNPTAGLAAGDVDVALLRLPVPGQDALRVRVLFTEPRCVVLPVTHRFATRDVIPFRELWDEPYVAPPLETGPWRDYWLGADDRDPGHPIRIGAATEHPDEWLTAIANGYAISLAPESAARFYARPDITYRPLTGVSPSQVAVAWAPSDDANPIIQDFVHSCLKVTHPHPTDPPQAEP